MSWIDKLRGATEGDIPEQSAETVGGNRDIKQNGRTQRGKGKGLKAPDSAKRWLKRVLDFFPIGGGQSETRNIRELAELSKHATRNNELLQGAYELKLNSALGTRMRMRPTPCLETLGISEQQMEEFSEWQRATKKRFYKDVYDSTWCDATREMNLQQQARLYGQNVLERGEGFATIFKRAEGTAAPYRTMARVLDPCNIRTPTTLSEHKVYPGNLQVHQGVLLRSLNHAPVGYYVHARHPDDLPHLYQTTVGARGRQQQTGGEDPLKRRGSSANQDPFQYVNKYSRFGRQQVVHSHTKRQAGMVRGIMHAATCLRTINCFSRYTEAQLETAILRSMIAFTIESDIPTAVHQILGTPPPSVTEDATALSPQIKAISEYQNLRNGFRDAGNQIDINGTIVPHLLSGEHLNAVNFANGNSDIREFYDVMFTLIARCLGLSKEMLTQDWSRTSYSGARAGLLSAWRSIRQFAVDGPEEFLRAFYACWFEDTLLDGSTRLPLNNAAPEQQWLFFVANRHRLGSSVWYGPAKDEIDRAKAAQWFVLEQTLGAYTVERYCNQMLEEDWEDVMEQQAREESRVNQIRANHGLPPLPPGCLHQSPAKLNIVFGENTPNEPNNE